MSSSCELHVTSPKIHQRYISVTYKIVGVNLNSNHFHVCLEFRSAPVILHENS